MRPDGAGHDLPDCLGLRDALRAAGFAPDANFELVYDELATSGRNPSLKAEIESKVRSYFESLVLPQNSHAVRLSIAST